MKKKIVLIIGVIVLILVPVIFMFYTKYYGEEIIPGKYYVVNSEEFPDAYIEVKKDKLFVHNLDLNSVMQERQLEQYYLIENNEKIQVKYGFTQDELNKVSDLNTIFGKEGYDYKKVYPIEEGSYEYWYPCNISDTIFGIHIVYNSWDKTITISNLEEPLVFER